MPGRSKYLRKKPSRDPLPTAMYAAEGKNTEREYIDALAGNYKLGKRFKRVNSASEPESIVKSLISKKKALCKQGVIKDYWIAVFDTEFVESRKKGIEKARSLAKKNGILCVESTPSFEYWLLLHFTCDDRPFVSQHEVEEALKQHLSDFTKHEGALTKKMSDLLVRVNQACENAEWILDNGVYGNRTEMPELVRIIKTMEAPQKNQSA